ETRLVPSGNDWSMYNFDAAGSRDNTAEHTLGPNNVGGLQVLWNFPARGVVAGTPAVVDGAIYAGDSTGVFYALTRHGKPLWQTQVDGPVTDSPLVMDDTVIFGTIGNAAHAVPGSIYGLDAQTGQVRWRVEPNTSAQAEIWGSATRVGDNVVIGIATGEEFVAPPPTSRGSLVMLDPEDGHVIWQTYTISDAQRAQGATGAAIWSTPAFDPETHLIYAGTGNNYSDPTTNTSDAMIAFDARDGHMVWVNQRTAADDWHPRFKPTAPDFDFADSPHLYRLADREQA